MKNTLVTILLALSLLGNAPSARADTHAVYFGTGGPGAEGIYRSTFDAKTGKLTAAELAHKIQSPGFLALHPDGTKLYAIATQENTHGVAAYHIAATGELRFFHFESTGDRGTAHLAVHPTGKFLLTAQYGGGSVSFLPLDSGGKPGTATVHKHEGGSGVHPGRQNAPHPHWCGFSPDGKFALVPDLGLDGIVIYAVNPDHASITRHGFAASVPGGGPRHMRFSNDGKFIYLLNELSLCTSAFTWDATTGKAERVSTTPSLSEETKAAESFNSAAEILIHPHAPFVYSSNRGHDSVTVYQIKNDGTALDVIQVQPIRGAFPRNINLDPSGKWLLAAGADSNTVAVHAVDPETGRLTYQRGSIINVPAPICILFNPMK